MAEVSLTLLVLKTRQVERLRLRLYMATVPMGYLVGKAAKAQMFLPDGNRQ